SPSFPPTRRRPACRHENNSTATLTRYDLHCHSTCSDGLLSPTDVVRRDAARDAGIAFVPGSELSVTWRDTTLHVLGLGVNPDDDALAAGLDDVRHGRDARARRIGDALRKAGIPEAFEGA